jgi:glycosyltransferase involved in cell wall biosynthesis
MTKADSSQPQPGMRHIPHIGMHLQGTARTDERVLREARALVQAGFAVTIVDTDPDTTRPRVEALNGITVRHIPKLQRRILPGKLGTAINMWRRLPDWIRALLALRADAYHAHDSDTLFATYFAARIRRKPVILDAHELPGFMPSLLARPVQRTVHIAMLRRVLPRVSAVITVSPPIVDEIQRLYGGPRAILVRNVPLYQPPITSDRLRERLQVPPTTRIALYQGGLVVNRSLDVLVRAARYLPDDVVIVLMGNGASKAGLEALIAAEGVGERVRLIPAAPYAELLSWTASADLGLILYTPETSLNVLYCLPNKLFEYLMAGVPVLSSQLPAVAEILTCYEAGQVCPSLEPKVVAASIAATLANGVGMAQWRSNALAASATDLNWEQEQGQLIGLYRRLLGANTSHAAEALTDYAPATGTP